MVELTTIVQFPLLKPLFVMHCMLRLQVNIIWCNAMSFQVYLSCLPNFFVCHNSNREQESTRMIGCPYKLLGLVKLKACATLLTITHTQTCITLAAHRKYSHLSTAVYSFI